MTDDSWRTRARTIHAPRRRFEWKRRGGLHKVSFLAAWTFQISGLSVVGTAVEARVATEATKVDDAIAVGRQRAGLCKQALQIGGVPDGERGRFDDELVFLDLNLVESAYIFAAAVVRCKLTASQTESARASMMVALKLSSSILTLSKPLTYFMRCKCTARQDRDCLDACVDRELLELGDSNRIIVNQDTSSQPRVSKRKTSRSQALPRLPSQRVTDTKCRPRSCSARLATWFFNFCTLPFGLIM